MNLETLKLMELSPDIMILVDVKGVTDQTRALANSACCISTAGIPASDGAALPAGVPAEELETAGVPADLNNNLMVPACTGRG